MAMLLREVWSMHDGHRIRGVLYHTSDQPAFREAVFVHRHNITERILSARIGCRTQLNTSCSCPCDCSACAFVHDYQASYRCVARHELPPAPNETEYAATGVQMTGRDVGRRPLLHEAHPSFSDEENRTSTERWVAPFNRLLRYFSNLM